MSHLEEMTPEAVWYVCHHLRASDWNEVINLCPHDDPAVLAADVYQTLLVDNIAQVAWHDGVPAAVMGFAQYRQGVWQAIMLSTDAFPDIARAYLKYMARTAMELRDEYGARRIQCETHVDHKEVHRFLAMVGAQQEGPPMLCYGKDGSSYCRFVWIKGVNDNLPKPRSVIDQYFPNQTRRV